jgi:hypothetical protein
VNHLNDDELVLHYYGEDGSRLLAAERHLGSCARCAHAYETIVRSLNAVTPPDVVEAPDDLPALKQLLRERVRERRSSREVRRVLLGSEAAVLAVVWLLALVYPYSFQAVFSSARLAEQHPAGALLVVLSLLWACVGPLAAVFALNRIGLDRGKRVSTRLLVCGALLAAIGPSLFVFVSRLTLSLSLNAAWWPWYGAMVLGAVVALVPWPTKSWPTPGVLYGHQLSAVLLTLYVLAHVINQSLAFVSLSSYGAMRNVMRVASEHPASYTVIVGTVVIQIATGVAMGLAKVRAGAFARNLQAVSGWCLAAFLLVHVFSGFLPIQPPQRAAVAAAAAANQFNLLATPRSAAQLPFLLLGVSAFLFHLGVYARLAAMVYLADAWVRRLSYAGMAVGATVVVTVGLSLCGIHLFR